MAVEAEGNEQQKNYEVLVCTGDLVYTGSFKYGFDQRLIDGLNEGIRSNAATKIVGFLPLTDATIIDRKGKETKQSLIYIAKNNIIFVGQVSSKAREKPLSTYPFREKLPIGVTIVAAQVYAAPYKVKGRIYVDTWGQVADTIESPSRFLPLTQVEIDPPLPGGGSKFDFIAINKERIISLSETPL